MDLDQYYDKIEAYLSNALSTADKADFEAEIKAEPALKKAILNHVLANEALGLVIEDKVAGKLQKLAQQRQEKENSSPLKSWWKQPLSIAAGVLFLVLTSLAIWANQNYSNRALANQFYAQSTLPTTRGEGTDDANFTNAMLAFNQQEYANAIELLNNTPSNNSTYISVQYLLGHAYLRTTDFEKAKLAFETLLTTPNLPSTIDRQEVEWNQVLATMNVSRTNASLFQQNLKAVLNNPEHAYYKAALALNNQLSSNWRRLSLGAF